MKEVLKKTMEEAKAIVSKVRVTINETYFDSSLILDSSLASRILINLVGTDCCKSS